MPRLEFWFDYASTYSYLAAMRIEDVAARHDLEIAWRPFLLGPIFQAQGWTSSPFNLYPAKGRYMIRDLQRLATSRGMPFEMPAEFPQNSLLAARVALVGEAEGWIAPFTKSIFTREFAEGRSIATPADVIPVLASLGLDTDRVIAAAHSPEKKQALRDRTTEASTAGLFGAPSFVTEDGEVFWGDDRLDDAVQWSTRK